MFLWASVAVNHTQNTSALELNAQQCLISFETAAHCREFELHFFNKCLEGECACFVCGNSWDLYTLWFSLLNKNQSLKVLKPHFYISILLTYITLVNFLNYFVMLHGFQKVVHWIFFSFSFSFPFNWSYVDQHAERVSKNFFSIHMTQTWFSLLFNDYQLSLSLFLYRSYIEIKVLHLKNEFKHIHARYILQKYTFFPIKWFTNGECSTILIWWFMFEL